MTARDIAIRDLLARANATGKRVYGFTGQYASCEELGEKLRAVPSEWTHLCVESDQYWSVLPMLEVTPTKE